MRTSMIFLLAALLLPLSMAYPCKGPCGRPYHPKPPKVTCPIEEPKVDGCTGLLGGIIGGGGGGLIGGIINIGGLGNGILGHCCPLFHGVKPEVACHCVCKSFSRRYSDSSSYIPYAKGLLSGCGYSVPELPCE